MELSRAALKQLTIWAPVGFIAFLTLVVFHLHPHTLPPWITYLMVVGLAGAGAYVFSRFAFAHIQRQEEEIVRRSEALAAINAIGTEITSLLEVEGTLRSVIEKAKQLLGTEVAALCLMDQKGCLIPRAIEGPQDAFGLDRSRLDPQAWETSCFTRPVTSEGLSEEVLRCSGIKAEYMKAHLAAPLKREGKVIGALCVSDRSPRRFAPLEVELLKGLATQAAIAIENARLHEQLQNMAVIEERHRIAREMHDGLAQDLGYLHLKLGQVEQMLASDQRTEVVAEVREMKKVAREAYEEVRQSILGLRTMVSRSLGLVPTLVEYLRHFEDQTGITVELKIVNEEATRFLPQAEIQLIRIIQEALSNVRKHSKAKQAWVTFSVEGEFVKVLIQDDGIGFNLKDEGLSPRPSFGLTTMRERAEGIGGSLVVATGPGLGTTVEVRLPLGR